MNNYGGAGSISLAAPGLPQGELQSVLQFNLGGALSAFDAQFGAGQWSIQSVTLQLTAASANNSIFNTSAAGTFGISWMQNDSWQEGTGTPAAPGASGITFGRSPRNEQCAGICTVPNAPSSGTMGGVKPETRAHPPVGEVVRPTTFVEAPRLGRRLGVELTIASETFQHTGSFKFRAAYHLASQVPQRHIITASSGNFGQGLARACQLVHKSCLVVMPSTSASIKVDAVREFGGEVDLIDVTRTPRIARVRELAALHDDAYMASPYDDPLVIAGNATLGAELAGSGKSFDTIIAPVGGGGLTSGIIVGLRSGGCSARVYGAEPELANDAARSLRSGRVLANDTEPTTIADGVRTLSVGQHNWAILRDGLEGIVEVTEEHIKESVRWLFTLANLKVEPTGALGVAALLAAPSLFRGQSVCCIASGGNVDPELFRSILAG